MSFFRDRWFKRFGMEKESFHLVKERLDSLGEGAFQALTECGNTFAFNVDGSNALQRTGCCKNCKTAVKTIREGNW